MFDRKKRFSCIESFEKNVVPDYYYSRYSEEEDSIEENKNEKTKKLLKILNGDKDPENCC